MAVQNGAGIDDIMWPVARTWSVVGKDEARWSMARTLKMEFYLTFSSQIAGHHFFTAIEALTVRGSKNWNIVLVLLRGSSGKECNDEIWPKRNWT